METVKTEWKIASPLLQEALQNVTEDHLSGDAPIKNPGGDFTNSGTLAFLAQHESYSIGQMAFPKKYLTGDPMKY